MVVSFGTAFPSGMRFRDLYSLSVGFPPYLAADLIKCLHCPFDDVEGIDAAFTVWSELIDTIRDPSCAVSGNDLYAGELLGCQLAVKLLQNFFAVSLGCPDDRIRIVIDDDRDVLVSLPVTGLIDTDVDKVVKASGSLRLDLVQCPVDTTADSLPVDAHVLRNGTTRQVDGEPSDSQVEVFCKTAPRISPWNIGNENPMLRAQNTVRTPGAGHTGLDIIRPASLMAEGTVILMPSVRACMDPEVVYTIRVLIKIVSGHNCGLDTEQLLA